MSGLLSILVIIFLAAVGVLGDYFIKLSGNGEKYIDYPPFFVGMILYALTAFGWFYVMKHIKLSTIGVFFALSNIVLMALAGVIFFKENLNTYDIIGIAFGALSIILLARFG